MAVNIYDLYKGAKNLLLKLDRECLNLHFLKSCKVAGVTPAFLKIRNKFFVNKFADLNFSFQSKCLSKVIREKYGSVSAIQKKVDISLTKLHDAAPQAVFDEFIGKISYFRERQKFSKLRTQSRKFQSLLSDQANPFRKASSVFEYINVSSRVFSPFEDYILKKGPKYIIPQPVKADVLVPQFEEIVHNLKQSDKEEFRNFLFFEFKNHMRRQPPLPQHELNALINMKKDPSISFLMTDKTNKLAIMDTTDLKAKILHCIQGMRCETQIKNPLNGLINKVKRLIKTGRKRWPDSMAPFIKENPTGIIPMLVVRLKDHKPQLPVRPIVPKNQAPTYFIEKAYVTLLKILLPPSPFTTKSTVDFIEKLKAITLPPDFLLATMDVVQLYPSINVDSVSKEIKTSIMSTIFSQETKDILIRGLNLILSSNFFTFDGTIYLQKHGAPMGSPISGLIAEFVLIPIDQQVNTLPNLKPYFWIRYVDDVFLIWEHGANEFNNFSQFVNTLNPDIQFTALLEDHGRISFLDVMLERKGTSILRSIYRKPGNALCTITASSLAPRNYKSAAYIAYIDRAIRVCSPENLAQEFVEIKSIAQKNGFPIVTIDKLINKLCNRTIAKTISINPDKRLMMQYIPNLFEKIRNRLKYYGINLVAKTLPKLGAFLPSKFDSFPPLDRNGIYEIPFLDRHGSKSFYVGMTKRKLKHRKYEHIHDIKTGSLNTALSRKYADELIDILFDQTKIIAPFNTNFQTRMRESIVISKRKGTICNQQTSLRVPEIWMSLFQ